MSIRKSMPRFAHGVGELAADRRQWMIWRLDIFRDRRRYEEGIEDGFDLDRDARSYRISVIWLNVHFSLL